jgi:mercuric ion binding protein
VLALLLLAAPAFAGEPRIAVLDVPGMNCSLCPISVRKALTRVPGVIDASAELASKRAVVNYDPDEVTPAQLATAVTNAGFPATVRSN